MQKRTYRMYGLVPYNISPIQQGIQFGHAVVEYANLNFNEPEYQHWALNDKTFIILNGGTTNNQFTNDGVPKGTLNKYMMELHSHGVSLETFYEPDLGDQLTAVVFLVDDRVFDRESWPDYNGTCYIDGTPEATEFWNWKMKFSENELEADKIVWLRSWLRNFKLA